MRESALLMLCGAISIVFPVFFDTNISPVFLINGVILMTGSAIVNAIENLKKGSK